MFHQDPSGQLTKLCYVPLRTVAPVLHCCSSGNLTVGNSCRDCRPGACLETGGLCTLGSDILGPRTCEDRLSQLHVIVLVSSARPQSSLCNAASHLPNTASYAFIAGVTNLPCSGSFGPCRANLLRTRQQRVKKVPKGSPGGPRPFSGSSGAVHCPQRTGPSATGDAPRWVGVRYLNYLSDTLQAFLP